MCIGHMSLKNKNSLLGRVEGRDAGSYTKNYSSREIWNNACGRNWSRDSWNGISLANAQPDQVRQKPNPQDALQKEGRKQNIKKQMEI